MVKEDEKEFRVIDRRSSVSPKDSQNPREGESKRKGGEETPGEGFVMKEGDRITEPMQLDFSTFVFSLATGAFIHLGLAPDPETKQVKKNPQLAQQNIDLLAMLKEKTKGNLTEDERTMLESLLTEVRLKFVEVSRKRSSPLES